MEFLLLKRSEFGCVFFFFGGGGGGESKSGFSVLGGKSKKRIMNP